MAHINLLPWREEQRAVKQRLFVTAILAAVLLTSVSVAAVWYGYSSAIEYQQVRNDLLRDEIVKLDKQIKEIRELERLKGQLVARMEVVENLQASRAAPVHFFNEIVRTLPEGIYLASVAMKGQQLTLIGEAQSNARVSAYMRALEASPWFEAPELVVIKTDSKGNVRSSNFTLRVRQVSEQQEDETEAAS